MNIEQLRDICLSFPGVTEDVKWKDNLCFLVANKIFLMVGLDVSPTPASFKVPQVDFNEVASMDGLQQAPYLARGQWIRTENVDNLSEEEWIRFAKQSYKLIRSKLTKKLQRELEEMK